VADDSAHFFTSSRTPRAVVSTGTEGLTPRTAARLPRLGAGCDVRVLRDRIVDRGVGDIPAADSGRVWNGNLDGPVRGVAAEVDRRQRDPLDSPQRDGIATDHNSHRVDRNSGDAVARRRRVRWSRV